MAALRSLSSILLVVIVAEASAFISGAGISTLCRTHSTPSAGLTIEHVRSPAPLRLRGGSVERRGRSENSRIDTNRGQISSPKSGSPSQSLSKSPNTQKSAAPLSSQPSWASIVAGNKPEQEQAGSGSSLAPQASGLNQPKASPQHSKSPHAKGSKSAPATAMRAHSGEGESVEVKGGDTVEKEDENTYYFNSYSHFGIHEEMLKDEVRTHGYRDAIVKNSHKLRGKIVLDVGCGTGILSMFAAQAGAAHVYAVDNSDMAYTCKEIVRVNGFEDRITVIKGDIETIDLPVDKVDVIVSEWMGYCLLYEAMFDTVLIARDKWLKPDGVILPDKASLYITAIEDAKYKNDKIYFWDSVYGFNMSFVKNAALSEPLVDTVDPHQICASTECIWEADLMTVKKEDLIVDSPFILRASRNDYVHALVAHFDVGFTMLHKPTWISTSPRERPTHWRQTVMYLHDELCINKGEEIKGHIRITPSKKNKRHLDFKIKYSFEGEAVNGVAGVRHNATHFYQMR